MNCLCPSWAEDTQASLRALTHLRACADKLAAQGHDQGEQAQMDGDQSVFGLWWPLMFGLATHANDPRLEGASKSS